MNEKVPDKAKGAVEENRSSACVILLLFFPARRQMRPSVLLTSDFFSGEEFEPAFGAVQLKPL